MLLLLFSVKTDEEVFLTPTLTLPTVFELSYNASSITSTFALESILGKFSLKTPEQGELAHSQNMLNHCFLR